VSHDLRNPLNIAEGYVDMMSERVDGKAEDDLQEIQDAHMRMENIIDDALTLARQGKAITETDELRLVEVAQDAWENVDTGDAELQIDVDSETFIEGDKNRLLNVFENLFRNSVEHNDNDDTVTVRVGEDEGGFYVEDDGEGIPEDERDEVLEHGYTTSEDGTGLGLSIVRDVVQAHGWEIDVKEGDEGGARFEIDASIAAKGSEKSKQYN
ncbi:MAG: HAMP domain-containing sensor histidine kinase, partial [Halobacteria archaeon]|nr:HAMP domain-containing sensor histidine kinase [Halobacteria archaeon]